MWSSKRRRDGTSSSPLPSHVSDGAMDDGGMDDEALPAIAVGSHTPLQPAPLPSVGGTTTSGKKRGRKPGSTNKKRALCLESPDLGTPGVGAGGSGGVGGGGGMGANAGAADVDPVSTSARPAMAFWYGVVWWS